MLHTVSLIATLALHATHNDACIAHSQRKAQQTSPNVALQKVDERLAEPATSHTQHYTHVVTTGYNLTGGLVWVERWRSCMGGGLEWVEVRTEVLCGWRSCVGGGVD